MRLFFSTASPRQMGVVLLALTASLPLTFVFPAQAERHAFSGGTWSRTYVAIINGDSLEVTSDGGFIMIGTSFGAWVMKANSEGLPEWERQYVAPRGYLTALGLTAQQTSDRGYLVMGYALSSGNGAPWLLKLNFRGDVEWSRIYGGQPNDAFSWVQQTDDGGYIVAGNTGPIGGHLSNGWLLKLDSQGGVLWQEAFEGEDIHSVQQTRDGGYVVAGTVGVSISTTVGFYVVAYAWVFKLDGNGRTVWQWGYGVTAYNVGHFAAQTRDGGYIVMAEAMNLSPNGYPLSSHSLIIKLDDDGNLLWQKLYGDGIGFTTPYSIEEMHDHGFVISGRSNGPFLLRVDGKGNLVWQMTYGGANDFFFRAQGTRSGGVIIAGWFGVTGSAWVLKTDAEGIIEGCVLEVLANTTFGNASITVTKTDVPSLTTRATATTTEVAVNIPPTSVETQCISTRPGRENE